MKIICLIGKANTGKTTSIAIALQRLRPTINFNKAMNENCKLMNYQRRGARDFCALITVKQKNGKFCTVGITTRGDSWELIEQDFELIGSWVKTKTKNYPKYFVCACRDSEDMVYEVESLVDDVENFVPIDKKCANDSDNKKAVRDILGALNIY